VAAARSTGPGPVPLGARASVLLRPPRMMPQQIMPGGMKRPMPQQPIMPGMPQPSKTPRTGGLAADGSWVCGECGNQNFKGRIYCNMRKCGAPGPWTCPMCGNENFAGRAVCNKRTCGQPRPPNTGAAPGAMPGMAMAAPGPCMAQGPARPQQVNQQAALQALALLQASGIAHLPGVAEGINKISQTVGSMGQVPGGCGGCAMGPKSSLEPKEGSWVCLACGNINYPNRTTCNAKLCQRMREEVDGGPPKDGANMKSIYMPGSWICGACQNVNWPQRESCGMRKCGKPRSEVDAGPPSPPTMMEQPVGQPGYSEMGGAYFEG